jgi:hypothetical protein
MITAVNVRRLYQLPRTPSNEVDAGNQLLVARN